MIKTHVSTLSTEVLRKERKEARRRRWYLELRIIKLQAKLKYESDLYCCLNEELHRRTGIIKTGV